MRHLRDYTTAAGDPVLGVPVTIATMNGEGMFVDVDGPLLLKNVSGRVVQYSGILPGVTAQDVATYMDVDGPLLLENTSGKVVQYSGILPGVTAQDVATYMPP